MYPMRAPERMMPAMPRDSRSGELNRREVLAGLGASLAGTLAVPTSAADVTPACVLTPVTSEGPFYFDPKLVRADITEGRPGARLSLALRVVSVEGCTPLEGARVDVWHADAHGVYSGYADQQGTGDGTEHLAAGKTFLRGTQFADRDGRAVFQTVFPSWYRGRTPHIHFKVFLRNDEVAVSQLYFPDEINEQVFTRTEPYRARYKERDTFNNADMYLRGGRTGGAFCDVTQAGSGWRAAVTLGIARG
jgi:protocatechuate 3,4-dioxygenase beta subunit